MELCIVDALFKCFVIRYYHLWLKYALKHCDSAEDMAKFVENYPEYKKMHGNVSKHVTIVTEMSKIVQERKLMLVSETEQELACNGGQGAAFEVLFCLYFSWILLVIGI